MTLFIALLFALFCGAHANAAANNFLRDDAIAAAMMLASSIGWFVAMGYMISVANIESKNRRLDKIIEQLEKELRSQ